MHVGSFSLTSFLFSTFNMQGIFFLHKKEEENKVKLKLKSH